MSLTVGLLLVALVVAGHVEQPAGDASLATSTTVPVVVEQAQLPREKLAPAVAGYVARPAWGDASTMPVAEAPQPTLPREKLATPVVAGHVAQPAWSDASTMPVVEALPQLTREKLVAPTNGDGVMAPSKIVVSDSFDLATSTKETYMAFLSNLDYHVNATGERWISHHPVLGRQNPRNAPATWFNLTVTGDGDDRVGFFMRSDNLYISGFTNKYGQLFSFRPEPDKYRMPGSAFLSFGNGYPDFFGRGVGSRGLLNVKINKDLALVHLNTLANYQSGTDQPLKLPAAFFVLIIAEAERFAPLRSAVFLRWEDDTARSIDDQLPFKKAFLIDLVVNWRTFSCAILSWNKHGETSDAWSGNDEAREIRLMFGVASPQDAISKLNPILQAVPWKCTWTPIS